MLNRMFFVVASLLCALGLASGGAFAGTIWYVKADAGGQNNGTSWEDAFTELQSALAVAESGDEIWVTVGTYLPDYDVNSGQHTLDREVIFQLLSDVGIYGGFNGTEQRREARNPEAHVTILSGDLLGDDGPDFENNDENSYHVTTGSGTHETAILDGFTVTAGNAAGPYPNGNGGGMYNDSGSPTLTRCMFIDNAAYNDGGGMDNVYSNPTLTHCIFSGNSAQCEYGGGMDNYESIPILTHCTFRANSAPSGGGMWNMFSNTMLTHCTFSGNSAEWGGGGMLTCESCPTLDNCTFGDNSAWYGGGMYNWYYARPTITNCTFGGNSAKYEGGGMYNDVSNPMVTNCTFSGNIANDEGGGMCNWGRKLTVANCILWGDTPNEIGGSADPVVTFCDVQGGWPGKGNIDTKPWFVAGPLGGPYLSHKAAGQPKDSPCIDAGDPSSPMIDGTTRRDEVPDAGIVDMGCHFPISGLEYIPGDRDGDRDVDLLDFTGLQACFTGPGPASPAPGCYFFDFEPDGDIDLDGYAVFHAALTGPK